METHWYSGGTEVVMQGRNMDSELYVLGLQDEGEDVRFFADKITFCRQVMVSAA